MSREKIQTDLPTDAELLTRFACDRDEEAFADLVQRHGPMVLGVCRQVLHRHHDAQDAFQATFLILASRPKSIKRELSVAGWLYRVAYRTAMRSAKRRQQRRTEEIIELPGDAADPLQVIYEQSLQTALHEELARLPASYRVPLVLCYMQGMSRSEAANTLECTSSSIKAKLARAKRLLRVRLSRRGVALAVAVTTAVKEGSRAEHAFSDELVCSTVTACHQASAAGVSANISPDIANLVKEGNQLMTIPMAKMAGVMGLATAAAFGCILLSEQAASDQPRPSTTVRIAQATDDDDQGRRKSVPVSLVADDAVAKQGDFVFANMTLANNPEDDARDDAETMRSEQAYAAKKAEAYFKLRDAQLEKARVATDKGARMEAEAVALLHEAEAEKFEREAQRMKRQLASVQNPGGLLGLGGVSVPPSPCCRQDNLAYGRSVTASSQEEDIDNFSQFAVDGDLSTRWCAETDAEGEWIQVDLGKPRDVKGIRVHWEMMNTAYAYSIETSADAKTWATVVDTSDAPKTEHMPEHLFDAPGTRYLRVTFLGADGYWASIREIEVTDDELPEPPLKEWEQVRPDADMQAWATMLFMGVER